METEVEMKPKKSVAQEMADLFHEFQKPKEAAAASLEAPWLFRIWDINQKHFLLLNKTLVAVPQGSNSPEELLAVVPNRNIKETKPNIFPIFMGLQDGKHVLSCVESGAQPNLQIMEKEIMGLYVQHQPLKDFTFFNHTEGNEATCSFESAAFPGWFLSTSREPDKPVGLKRSGGADITTFYFEKRKK